MVEDQTEAFLAAIVGTRPWETKRGKRQVSPNRVALISKDTKDSRDIFKTQL